ncbi:MAG: hypothetical protein AB9869_34980 [Verrucomicrobiia bacterium]
MKTGFPIGKPMSLVLFSLAVVSVTPPASAAVPLYDEIDQLVQTAGMSVSPDYTVTRYKLRGDVVDGSQWFVEAASADVGIGVGGTFNWHPEGLYFTGEVFIPTDDPVYAPSLLFRLFPGIGPEAPQGVAFYSTNPNPTPLPVRSFFGFWQSAAPPRPVPDATGTLSLMLVALGALTLVGRSLRQRAVTPRP